MTIKKHIPVEGYAKFTRTFPLFAPLGEDERNVLSQGETHFRKAYPEIELFPDPFLDVDGRPSVAASFSLTELLLVRGSGIQSHRIAMALAGTLREKWGVDVPILSDDDPEARLSSTRPLLLIGGADSNRLSLELAKKYQVGVFNFQWPGSKGWGITTYWELEDGIAPRLILACDEHSQSDAIKAFLSEAVAGGRSPTLQWIHRIVPGEDAPAKLGDFRIWLSGRSTMAPLVEWFASGQRQPYRDVFATFFRGNFSEALPYNADFIDLGIHAIRYYQATGSQDALNVYREMLWGFWFYLNSEDPQIYISDMDFRIGLLCNYWNWIEHHPDFTPAVRSIFTRLHLGATRIVHGYFRKLWRDKPAKPHNHQTFKARSLILAWRYFKRWNLPELGAWKDDAGFIFESIDPRAFKHRENASQYETFIPEHTLVWHETIGRTIPQEFLESLSKFSGREWAMLDNFFFALDYGDSDPVLKRSKPISISSWLSGDSAAQREIIEREAATRAIFPFDLPPAHRSFTGLNRPEAGEGCSLPLGWMREPLDPSLEGKFAIVGKREFRFDKLSWRSGWMPESAYVAVEGIGNTSISHGHNEVNGILRMNLAGRIWLVSNGYGKRSGIADAGEAFSTRNRGPEDHNMLVLWGEENGKSIMPPANAELLDLGEGPLPYSVSRLSNYGGTEWTRHILILPNSGFVIVDKVSCSNCVGAYEFELQWNVLGSVTPYDKGSRVEQAGVTMVFQDFGTANSSWHESGITAWRNHVASGAYQHTHAMPNQWVLKPKPGAGRDYYFVNGFWLDGSILSHGWDACRTKLSLRVENPLISEPALFHSGWGEIGLNGDQVEIAFT